MPILNPNHPVMQEMGDKWHAMVAILMHKFGKTHVVITLADVEKFSNDSKEKAVILHAHQDSIELKLVTVAEAEKMAKEEGGLLV